jgi:hypothetical protein
MSQLELQKLACDPKDPYLFDFLRFIYLTENPLKNWMAMKPIYTDEDPESEMGEYLWKIHPEEKVKMRPTF